MTKEEDIKKLYTSGWAEKPQWAKELHWNYSLWWAPELGESLHTTLTSYCQQFIGVRPDKQIVGPDGSPYLDGYCLAEPWGWTQGHLRQDLLAPLS